MRIDRVRCNWHVLYPVGYNPLLDQMNKNKLNWKWFKFHLRLQFFSYFLVVKQARAQDVFNKTGNVRINVTLRRVRVTTVAVILIYVLNTKSVCLSSCRRYPARKAHLFCAVLYCYLWPVRLYRVLPHYFVKRTTFGKKKVYWTHDVCFDFLYNCNAHL